MRLDHGFKIPVDFWESFTCMMCSLFHSKLVSLRRHYGGKQILMTYYCELCHIICAM